MQVQVEKKQKAFTQYDDIFPGPFEWDDLEIGAAFDESGSVEVDIEPVSTVSEETQETIPAGDAQGQKIPAPKLGEGKNGELNLIEGKGGQDPLDPVTEQEEQMPEVVEPIETIVQPVVQEGPIVSFDEKQRLVIETNSFKEAWKTAGYYLTPNVGETWIWRRRNKVDPTKYKDGLYGYGFASAAAWFNHTHNKLQDVDLELLKEISGNVAAYDKVKRLKVDVLLSDHLVNLVYSAQRVIYPKHPSKHTGKHDPKVMKQDMQKWKTEQAKLKQQTTLKETGPKVPGAVEGGAGGGVIDTLLGIYIDMQPSTWIIRYLLEQYDKLPQAEKEQRAKASIQKKIAELNKDKNEGAPDWMKYLSPGLATAWDFVTAAQLGYYKHMATLSPKSYVNLVTRSLRVTLEPDFYKGIVGGILPGIGSWFEDLWESIKAIASLVSDVAQFAWNLPTHLANAYEGAKAAGAWIADNAPLIQQFIGEMMSNSQVLPELAAGIKQSFLSMAESAGKSMAEGAVNYISKSYYEQGKSVGSMIGYIIPEIILAIFSGAIGNALKLGLKGLQLAKKAISSLKAFEKAADLLHMARAGLMKLREFFKSFSLFKKSTYAPIKGKFDEIIDMMAEFFGFKIDEMADVTKHLDDVNGNNMPEVSDVTKRKEDLVTKQKEVAGTKQKQWESDAEREFGPSEQVKKDSNLDEADQQRKKQEIDNDRETKKEVYIKAKVIKEIADKEDAPVPVLMGRLAPLTKINPKLGVRFDYERVGEGVYRILMYASPPHDLGSYTTDSKTKKTKGQPEEQLTDAGKYDPVPPTPDELSRVLKWQEVRNKFLHKWRDIDLSQYSDEVQKLIKKRPNPENSIRKSLTPDDLAAALKEKRGVQIFDKATGKLYDHIQEVENAMTNIKNSIVEIKARIDKFPLNELNSPNAKILTERLADLSNVLDYFRKYYR